MGNKESRGALEAAGKVLYTIVFEVLFSIFRSGKGHKLSHYNLCKQLSIYDLVINIRETVYMILQLSLVVLGSSHKSFDEKKKILDEVFSGLIELCDSSKVVLYNVTPTSLVFIGSSDILNINMYAFYRIDG